MVLTVPLKMSQPSKLRIESSHRLHDATSADGPRSLLNFENRPLPAGWYRIRLETLSLPRVCTVNLLPDFGDGLVEAPLVNVILQSEVCEFVLVRFPSSVMQIAYAAPTLFFEVRHVDLESLTFFQVLRALLARFWAVQAIEPNPEPRVAVVSTHQTNISAKSRFATWPIFGWLKRIGYRIGFSIYILARSLRKLFVPGLTHFSERTATQISPEVQSYPDWISRWDCLGDSRPSGDARQDTEVEVQTPAQRLDDDVQYGSSLVGGEY